MGDRDDFIRFMPNMQQQATRMSSDNSQALKEYMAVLGDRVNIPVESGMHKDRREGLQYRYGTGRVAPKRHFTIKIRPEEAAAEEAATMAEAARLDPEELKDALIQQAQAERRRVLQATLRPGTGRRPPKCSFQVVVRPLEPTPQPPPAPGAIVPESQMAQVHSNQDNIAGAGADGLSPMEGVPELRLAVNSSWTPSVYHNQQQRSSSPIKGVISHAAAGNNNNGAPHPQNAPQGDFSFGGYDDDDYGGGDFGGGYDDYGGDDGGFEDYGQQASPNQQQQPFLFGSNVRMQMYQQDPSRPRPRRHVLNPGIRLKNELPRKSFAYHTSMGRQEVAPGIRRSTRQAKSPLRWWLNEIKVYGREHKTMPTVEENVKMESGAIWRTAVDPLSKRGRIDHSFGGSKRARTKPRHGAAHAADNDDNEVDEDEELLASPSSSAPAGRKRTKGGRSRRRRNGGGRSRRSKQQAESESAAGADGVDSENDSMMVDGDNAADGLLSTVHEEEEEAGAPGSAAAAAAMPGSIESSRGKPQPASPSEFDLFDMFEDTDIGDATTETNGAAAAGGKTDADVDNGAVSQPTPAPMEEDEIVIDEEDAKEVDAVVVGTEQDIVVVEEEEEEGQQEMVEAVDDEDEDGGLQELLEEELAALSPANVLMGTAAFTSTNALFSPASAAADEQDDLEEGELVMPEEEEQGTSPSEVPAHVPAHGDEEFADDEALLEEEEEEEEEIDGDGDNEEVVVASGNGAQEEVEVEEAQLPEEEEVPSPPLLEGVPPEEEEEEERLYNQVVMEGEDGVEEIDSDAETVGGAVTMRRSARR